MGEKANKLNKSAQLYVVGSLARYERNEDIIKGLKEKFNIDVSSAAITYYDPEHLSRIGRSLSSELEQHFNVQRRLFRESIESVPSSSQVVRLQRLERMAIDLEKKGNYQLAAKLYKQIAEEVGGMYNAKNGLLPLNNAESDEYHEDNSISDAERMVRITRILQPTTKEGTGQDSVSSFTSSKKTD